MPQNKHKHYFFCGIGGSGMMPLSLILGGQGCIVSGSDRSLDQAETTPDKFKLLQDKDVQLYSQDGSGVEGCDILVVSGAIEDSIPDVARAKALNIPIKTRAEILANLFNSYETSISVAGTSGKSSVTGMLATIYDALGQNPTVMNGGFIVNFEGNPACPASNMRLGSSDVFITETDESDGSIALYNPAFAVVNNIALDHMPIEQLEQIFTDFIQRTTRGVALNADNPYLQTIIADKTSFHAQIKTYSLNGQGDLNAENIRLAPNGCDFTVSGINVHLSVPARITSKMRLPRCVWRL